MNATMKNKHRNALRWLLTDAALLDACAGHETQRATQEGSSYEKSVKPHVLFKWTKVGKVQN